MTTHQPPVARSLRTQIAIVFGGFTAMLAVSLCLLGGEMLKLRQQHQAAAILNMATNNAATMLNEEIRQQYHRTQILAHAKELWSNGLDAPSVRTLLDRVQHINPQNVWIGVADTTGVVRNATGGLLQGADVSERPWFQKGLHAPFISEVHPAKLLASLLPPSASGEPLRLVDFSAPIYDADGNAAGVLGIHASWDWVRDSVERLLQGMGKGLQHTIFIFDHQGELIYAPAGVMLPYSNLGQRLPLDEKALRAALAGKPVQVTWMDRARPYLTTATQLPSTTTDLGWWIVARQPIETAYAGGNRILWLALAIGLVVGFLAAVIAWYLARHLSEDLKALAQAAHKLQNGATNTPLPVSGHNREVLQLSQSLSHMTQQLLNANEAMKQQVLQRTQELEVANQELQRQASTDPLTKLLNRRGFDTQAALALALACRGNRPLSVLTLDIDFFKRINDTYGHDVGDVVLQRIAQALTQRARQTDIVARFGGEEFVLLLPDTDAQAATALAEALRRSIAQQPIPPVGAVQISIGVSSLRCNAEDSLHALLKRSDEALYRAKQSGRNRVCLLS